MPINCSPLSTVSRGLPHKRAMLTAIALCTVMHMSRTCLAQCAPHWVMGATRAQPLWRVYAMAAEPNGDLVFGGYTLYDTIPGLSHNIGKWRPTTREWLPIGSNTLSIVPTTIGITPNGTIVAAGPQDDPTTTSSSTYYLFKLDPVTNLWANASPLPSSNGYPTFPQVNSLTPLPNGDVIIAGSPSISAPSFPQLGIARYSPATGTWSPLGQGIKGSFPRVLCKLLDGKLLISTTFVPTTGIWMSYLGLYDPAADTYSVLSAPNLRPTTAVALANGDVVLGGTTVVAPGLGAESLGVVRLNLTTGEWTALGSGLSSASSSSTSLVSAVTLLADGDLLATGRFTQAGGYAACGFARFNFATGQWVPAGTIVPNGGCNPTTSTDVRLLTLSNGDVALTKGSSPGSLHLYHPGSDLFSGLGSGLDDHTYGVIPLPNGDVAVFGQFQSYRDTPLRSIARYQPRTREWSPLLDRSTAEYGTGIVTSTHDLWLFGPLSALSSPTNYLRVAPDGTWSEFPETRPPEVSIASMCALPTGDIACESLQYDSNFVLTHRGFTVFHPPTNTWTSLGTQAELTLESSITMCALNDGGILVGGQFQALGSTSARTLARLDPANGAWSDVVGFPSNAPIGWVSQTTAGDLYVTTRTDFANGGVTSTFRAHTTGGPWTQVGGNNSLAATLSGNAASLPNGSVVVGTFNVDPWSVGLARYDPSSDSLISLGTFSGGTNGDMYGYATTPRGEIVVAGEFAQVGGVLSAEFAVYSDRPDCLADFDCSGALGVGDIFEFLRVWFAGTQAADMNASGGVSVQDIFDFLQAWFRGC